MQVAPHRAPLLLVHRAAGCLGLEAGWAVLPMPGNAQERTGVVLKADSCRFSPSACPFWKTFPRKALGGLFLEQMHHRSGARGVVGRCGAQTSFAACDRRAKSFDRQLPDTSHLTRVNSCGKFAAVQRGVCLYAWAAARPEQYLPVCLGSSTAARQHSGILSVSSLFPQALG